MDSKQKIYKKFSEIESQLNGSKHAKLQDIHHADIVPFNQPKKPVKPKIAEIKRKLQTLPDGIYCVVAQDRFGKNVHQDRFYFGKGKYESGMSEPTQQFTPNPNPGNDHLLSLDSAVTNIKEAAELKAKCGVLEAECTRLKEEVSELKRKCSGLESEAQTLRDANEELSQGEEEAPDAFNGLAKLFEPFAPMLPGLADRYFDLKKQQNETTRAKLLLENGYELPGAVKKNNSAPGGKKKSGMPQPGTPEWEQYVEEVKALDDEQFAKHLQLIEEKFPSLYPYLYEDVMDEGEEEETE